MAKVGRKFIFHGAFKTKAAAMRKEAETGGFIRRARVKGSVRYVVLTRKGQT